MPLLPPGGGGWALLELTDALAQEHEGNKNLFFLFLRIIDNYNTWHAVSMGLYI